MGSLRRAAELCHVNQSNVSRALKQLEDHLGVSLFERTRSGVRLTQGGEHLLADVSPPLEQPASARRSTRAALRAEPGLVRIGIPTRLRTGSCVRSFKPIRRGIRWLLRPVATFTVGWMIGRLCISILKD
jgi:DNA-binding transcriptional LysR family regulator